MGVAWTNQLDGERILSYWHATHDGRECRKYPASASPIYVIVLDALRPIVSQIKTLPIGQQQQQQP